jgi:ABC-type bacteriocin/lantibiotic exporter with double-glycine peptidase domain
MRLQSTQANCGPASLHNALAALGISRTEDELIALCKTTGTEGTSSKNLMGAVRAVGRHPLVVNERRAPIALLWLEAWLREGRPVILCVDDNSHWVTAVGALGSRLLVADPANNELVLAYDRVGLLERWESEAGRFYGVVV